MGYHRRGAPRRNAGVTLKQLAHFFCERPEGGAPRRNAGVTLNLGTEENRGRTTGVPTFNQINSIAYLPAAPADRSRDQ